MRIHDLIIGDLGRKGTLRYFKNFSHAEQKYLLQNLDGDEFYDEYRKIRYTIVGAIRDIKSDFLPDSLEEIEDSCLVGVEGGPAPIDILPQVCELAIPYVNNSIEMGASLVRIIIPCNTMYSVVVRLRDIFSGPQNLRQFLGNHNIESEHADTLLKQMKSAKIQVPAVAEEVVTRLDQLGKIKVKVAASKFANKAYEKVINKHFDHMEYQEWLPPGVESFSKLLQMAFQGEPIDVHSSITCETDAVVSACTDIAIPDTTDSVTVFAESMVQKAYQQLTLN